MSDDHVKRLRRGTIGDKERHAAADHIEHLENRCANLLVGNRALNIHIEKLETGLHEVVKINNRRDRFSPEIDAVIVNALGEYK